MSGDRADEDVTLEDGEQADELDGSMERSPDEQRLMHSVMENDEQTVNDGRLVQEAQNISMGNFTPDVLFEKLVKDYEEVAELYGETILREVTGHEPSSLERNIRIPEFKRMLKEQLSQRMKALQERGILDKQFGITDQGFLLAALVLIKDELDHLQAVGFGKREQKQRREDPSQDVTPRRLRYKDFDLKRSLGVVARRGHERIVAEDMRFREQESEGKISILYALDASGSMKGKKLALAKRAGVALAYEAIRNNDDVGLLAFGSQIETTIPPGKRFLDIVHALTTLKAKRETDIANAIRSAVPLLKGKSKHLVLLTDALHTAGSFDDVLAAAQEAKEEQVSISIIGINLDKEGEELSQKIIDLTQGRFYRVQNLQEMDLLILEDYARLKR